MEANEVNEALTAMFNGLEYPFGRTDKRHKWRPALLKAMDYVTRYGLMEAELKRIVDTLSVMRKASKKQEEEIDRLRALSSGGTTQPTMACQAIGRGIDEAEPKEG